MRSLTHAVWPILSAVVASALVVHGCGDAYTAVGSPDAAVADATPSDAIASDASDAGTALDAGPPMCDVAKPFGAPSLVTELDTSGDDSSLRLSSDYLTGFFTSGRGSDAGVHSLWSAARADAGASFSSILEMSTLSTGSTGGGSAHPSVTGDGLTIYFDAPASGGNLNIFVAARSTTAAAFQGAAPVNVASTGVAVQEPFIREDGQALYFSSTINGANALYVASRTASGFSAPSLISEVSSGAEQDPMVTPDDLVIYYSAQLVDGGDIWVGSRASPSDPFSAIHAVTELNTTDAEHPDFITRDRCTIYFHRTMGSATDGGPQARSVYVATKTP